MKNSVVLRERDKKPFKIYDLFVYGAVLILTAALFLVVFLRKDTRFDLEIYLSDVKICTYSFARDEFYFENGGERYLKIAKTAEGYLVRITSEKGYNDLSIDKKGFATMPDSDCSASKECTYMKIASRGESIVCVPHRLLVTATGQKDETLISG